MTGAGSDRMGGDIAFPTPDIATSMGATDEFVFNLDSDNSGSADEDDNFGNDAILDANTGDVPDIIVLQNVPGGTFADLVKISKFAGDRAAGDAIPEVYSFDITAGTRGASPIGTFLFGGIDSHTARSQPLAALASTTGVAAQLATLDKKTVTSSALLRDALLQQKLCFAAVCHTNREHYFGARLDSMVL